MQINRRTVLKGLGSVPLIGAAPYIARAQDKPERLTVTTFGGSVEKAIREIFVADFTARTGIQVDLVLGTPFQWISQVQASPQRPPYDVVLCGANQLPDIASKGLFDDIRKGDMKHLDDVPHQFIDMCEGVGVAYDYGTVGLVYHKDRVKTPPKSLREFIERTIAGDWIASVPSINDPTSASNLIYSLNDVLGGTLDDITPVIDAVKKMRPNMIFWNGLTDFPLQVRSGDADIGIYVDGRTWAEYDAGSTYLDFINPAEGGIMAPGAVLKPIHANPWAWQFIDTMLAPEQQARFADRMYFGMTNQKVVYSDKAKSKITPWEKTRLPPAGEIGKRIPAWVERWNREIGG